MQHENSAGAHGCTAAHDMTGAGGRAVAKQVARDLGDEDTKSHDRSACISL